MTIRKLANTLILLTGVCLLATACHFTRKPPAITGTGIYLLNVPLPADAVVTFKFVQTSSTGEVTNVIDTLELRNIRRAPIPFEIPYSRSEIKRRNYYAITCEIRSGNKVLFRSPRPFAVLTHGGPSNVEVLLEQVR